MYDLQTFKKRLTAIEERFSKELMSIHTGRATPTLLDGITFDAYGARTSIAHAASITTDDPRTVRVIPWDKTQIKAMEKAIDAANLGISVSVDQAGIRVFFPELTGERRVAFVKAVGGKLEEARVSVRKEREALWSDVQEKEKTKEISEDDKFRIKNMLQELVDVTNNKLENIASKKEHDIMF
ncbi:MAG: ribosome recycling factor [Candidatus Yonathbacteria bacterium CG_4_10_14_3_um_filter_47_65]|uniref:Ribosome recycling factor n=2 Tax=Parcubacteria group TaxID=1794811 RepID=A0A2M8D9F3_9BACT|nr:MAG: hypothetical protein AUJ44_02970 [Candidatus Nomurabacteria bacterium CG1_02_47_685]PIP03961.1 MAG: ribosome recycling factor [Candidatus Yonathbacteria bacterium CG23_combo_of_CG06-09_8_20_14_all_46_18]PIQ33232.1 MAG: ribosome recycling factor [Candidatus Yonathbacteria bacterium CG17_big_fil_post_rev_8_21_14_2_50_46_19]PIX56576.1 MAG: ribosome recycling factor [Candidatus Yonathbacteria bacterium CG_4_10_14_3_um_filter_47_65]PIY57427.1 MAG: ribosome recycling factor [Candidatus Yonath